MQGGEGWGSWCKEGRVVACLLGGGAVCRVGSGAREKRGPCKGRPWPGTAPGGAAAPARLTLCFSMLPCPEPGLQTAAFSRALSLTGTTILNITLASALSYASPASPSAFDPWAAMAPLQCHS